MPVEDMVAYPAALFGVQAPQARGLCLFRLGRYREAAAAYGQAEAFEPSELSHRARRVIAEQRARQVDRDLEAVPPSPHDGVRWPARELLRGVTVDVGGVSVGLSASDAVRAGAIHEMLGRMPLSERRSEVHMSFGRYPVPFPECEADETQGSVRLWHDDDAFSIAWGTQVSGRAKMAVGQIGGHVPNLAGAFRFLAPFVLASLLGPWGRFVLHAGAIERDGRAVLVLGDSGAGKSTLIFGAIEDGWSVLADDLVLVRSDPSGPSVSGIPKALVVPAEVMGERAGAEPSERERRGRVRLPFEAWNRGWHPVEGVVLAGHGNGARSVIEPVGRPDRLGLLLRAMLSRQPGNVRRYFSLAVTLSELPGGRLLHSRPPETRARDAAHAIANQLG